MPQLIRMLDESYKSFVRPAITTIIRELMVQTGIPEGTTILYPGSHEVLAQPGSTLNAVSKDSPTGNAGRWKIEVKIERPDDTAHLINPHYMNNVAIFKDPLLDIVINPIYDQIEINISINARFEDETSATKWRDDIRTHSSILREENIHSPIYHWGIPRVFLVLLYQLYACRERVAGYGDTRSEWLLSSFSKKVKTIKNQAGEKHHLVVAETQAGVPGYFDFATGPDDPELVKDKGYWEYTFGYKLHMAMPTGAKMRYPLVVHNQVLSPSLRSSETPFRLSKKFLTPGAVKASLDHMEYFRNPYANAIGGISIPKFDDWLPANMSAVTADLIRCLIMIDPSNPKDVTNLETFDPYYQIEPLLIDMIKLKPMSCILPDDSILRVTLFKDKYQIDPTKITIDSSLNISTVEDMSLRLSYHMVVSLVIDVAALTGNARRDLQVNGLLALKYFAVLAPELVDSDLWPELTPNGHIELYKFNRIMDYLGRRSSKPYVHGDISNRSIGNIVIQSQKKGDL